jgi:AraC-like DNA-binding protein
MVAEITTSLSQTNLFEEWESQLSLAIGHHSSSLLTPDIAFSSTIEVTRSSEVSAVELIGYSSVRLHRHQPCDQVVLWLPRSGWVCETLNGHPLVAEPGTALLCLPGDELIGETTLCVKGVSVLLPASLLGCPAEWNGFSRRHLSSGSESVAVVQLGFELVSSLKDRRSDCSQLVQSLADQLIFWRHMDDQTAASAPSTGVDRRRLIAAAQDWFDAHLCQPVRVADIAVALHVSARHLQYCFCEELGHSPLAELRRIRFRKLRQLLLNSSEEYECVEALFASVGLAYTPVTRNQYQEWSGETPLQTRARATAYPFLCAYP